MINNTKYFFHAFSERMHARCTQQLSGLPDANIDPPR